MIKFIIKYAINKSIFKRVLIEATTLAQAYVSFLVKFPKDYEITEITETTAETVPADVECPKPPRVKYTVC